MSASLKTSNRFETAEAKANVARAIEQLRPIFGDRLSVGSAVREQHGRGEAYAQGFPPDAVIWPINTAEVSRVAKVCNELRVPLIAFGAGTSLEGHVSALYGGICLDMSRMNQVLEVRADDADCVVQPGITREELNAYLRDTGFYFPIDPGANASIGGMISTRASGTNTIRYGTIAQNVMALEVVLANGEVIRCGNRARKSSAGYDLVRLFTGSEGTLGIITEATLRLHGQPEAVGSSVCAFPDLRGAVDTVIELIQSGAPVSRIEFLDEVQVRACNAYSKLSLPEQPTLFIEFMGTAATVTEQFERAVDVVKSHGATSLDWAFDEQRRAALWKARHSAYFAARALRPATDCIVADVCVPISQLANCVAETRAEIDAAGLLAPILGHVGDGNFHVLFLIDPSNEDERTRMERVYDSMIATAHRLGGTCTGEHGIGLGKRDKLIAEFGAPVVELMRKLKDAWDPNGILNPGKVFELN
ncbi:FAD-binding oxidoreductase [Steroidobacter sp.]|uniref:FAD-binding oxidoreductase n=1 Tax=Steroidobacter sp. TaxID=1978227 RepID=UPI001A3A70A2|nr:FAD-linked oxidase C-terminal domain-containing protein [Steroidobacter sp.]MBL8266875.1 FAD-binding protein [Steroidobacter sp.]